jgi:SAM-dependent methyltransferase
MSRGDDWTVGFFDHPYTELFPFPDGVQTDAEVDGLLRLIPASPARILDVGCGQGRHAVRLAEHGFRAAGLAPSEWYGGLSVEPFDRRSQRMVVKAQRVR